MVPRKTKVTLKMSMATTGLSFSCGYVQGMHYVKGPHKNRSTSCECICWFSVSSLIGSHFGSNVPLPCSCTAMSWRIMFHIYSRLLLETRLDKLHWQHNLNYLTTSCVCVRICVCVRACLSMCVCLSLWGPVILWVWGWSALWDKPSQVLTKIQKWVMELQVVVPQAFQDLDKALQSKHVAPVWPIMYGCVAAETLEGGVGEVDHANVHQGGLLGQGSGRGEGT